MNPFRQITPLVILLSAFISAIGTTAVADRAVSVALRAMELSIFDDQPMLFDRDDREPMHLYYRSAGQEHELWVPSSNFSSQFHYKGPEQLVFYRKQIGANGEKVEVPVTDVRIPEGVHRGLLLVLRNPKNQSTKVVFVDNSSDKFPDNSIRVLNLTTSKVACAIGEETLHLEPRGSGTVILELNEPDTVIFQLAQYNEDSSSWVRVFTTGIGFLPGRQQLVLVTPDMRIQNRLNPTFYSMNNSMDEK